MLDLTGVTIDCQAALYDLQEPVDAVNVLECDNLETVVALFDATAAYILQVHLYKNGADFDSIKAMYEANSTELKDDLRFIGSIRLAERTNRFNIGYNCIMDCAKQNKNVFHETLSTLIADLRSN